MSSNRHSLALFGANRGGAEFLGALRRAGAIPRTVVVDPEPGRAARLKDRYGFEGDAFQSTAELFLPNLAANALVVAATDNPASNMFVWEQMGSRQRTALQAVLRTRSADPKLPGVVVGFSALTAPNRYDAAIEGVFRELATIPRQSSADFTDDRLSAYQVAPARSLAATATAEAVLEPARRLESVAPNRLTYRGQTLPLLSTLGPAGDRAAWDCAEELARASRLEESAVLVRSGQSGAIDLVVIREGRGVGLFPLYRRPQPRPSERSRGNHAANTLVTD